MVLFQDALNQLRGISSGLPKSSDAIENLQSRARELEKKVCLFINVVILSWIV